LLFIGMQLNLKRQFHCIHYMLKRSLEQANPCAPLTRKRKDAKFLPTDKSGGFLSRDW
jgi:hypothetical protein